MAPLYRVVINIPNKELRSRFDAYWAKNGDDISKKLNVKGRKGKGGKQSSAQKIAESAVNPRILYLGAMPDLLNEYFKDILFIESLEIYQFEDDKPEEDAQVLALLYFYPEIHRDGPINMKLDKSNKVEIEEEKEWENRQREIKAKNIEYKPVEGDLTADHECMMDLLASVDGKPEEAMSFRKQWRGLKYLPKGLQDEIIKHKVGDLFEYDFVMGEVKTVHYMIKLYDAREGVLPEVTEELAKKEGFDSIEKMKENFLLRYNNYVETQMKQVVAENIIHGIMMSSTFDPFPLIWVKENIARAIEHYKDRVKGDEAKLLAMFGAKDMSQVEDNLKSELYRDTLQRMALKYYAKEFKVGTEEPNAIIDHMLANVEWIEKVEEPEVKE